MSTTPLSPEDERRLVQAICNVLDERFGPPPPPKPRRPRKETAK